MILGITGGTGCGKTTLLSIIAEHGGLVIDCDKLYHDLLRTDTSLLQKIENRFPSVVNDGVLERKELGKLVFGNQTALHDLNTITQPFILDAVSALLSQKPKLAAIDAIRLFESGLDKFCDITVAVTAPTELRIERLMQRDRISREYATDRIFAQPNSAYYSHRCDYALSNDGTEEEFRNKCLVFLKEQAIITL